MAHFTLIDVPEEEMQELTLGEIVEIEDLKYLEDLQEGPSFEVTSPVIDESIVPEGVNMELSYAFWFPPSAISEDLDQIDDSLMVVQRTIGTRAYQGTAAVKVAAKDGKHYLKIPKPPASGQVSVAGADGVTTMRHTPSDWSQLIRLFKKMIDLALNVLLIYWGGASWGALLRLFKRLKDMGLGPRLPWHSNKKERMQILGLTGEGIGSAKYEFKMDPYKGHDYHQSDMYKLGWDIPSDVRNFAVLYRDSDHSDNDGHYKCYMGFFG